jgi:hypothetical protein
MSSLFHESHGPGSEISNGVERSIDRWAKNSFTSQKGEGAADVSTASPRSDVDFRPLVLNCSRSDTATRTFTINQDAQHKGKHETVDSG